MGEYLEGLVTANTEVMTQYMKQLVTSQFSDIEIVDMLETLSYQLVRLLMMLYSIHNPKSELRNFVH